MVLGRYVPQTMHGSAMCWTVVGGLACVLEEPYFSPCAGGHAQSPSQTQDGKQGGKSE